MITVYKYPLKVEDSQEIFIPNGFIPLCVQYQNDSPCLWVQVDTEKTKQKVRVRTYGTGHKIDMLNSPLYAGTYQSEGGMFVFHVYLEY